MKPITIISSVFCLFIALATQTSAQMSGTTGNTTTADQFIKSITTVLVPVMSGFECFEPTTFTATITTNMAGTLKYQWVNTWGFQGPVETLVFSGASTKQVSFSMNFTPIPNVKFSGGVKLRVVSPVVLESNQVNLSRLCPKLPNKP